MLKMLTMKIEYTKIIFSLAYSRYMDMNINRDPLN